jgi:ribosome modulation factor
MYSYRNGRADYHRGISCDNPPHLDALRRIPWIKGWLDSRADHIAGAARVRAMLDGKTARPPAAA